jgi:hypothetical protein
MNFQGFFQSENQGFLTHTPGIIIEQEAGVNKNSRQGFL